MDWAVATGLEVVDEAMAVETGLEEEVEEAARESLEALEVELEEVATAEDQAVEMAEGSVTARDPEEEMADLATEGGSDRCKFALHNPESRTHLGREQNQNRGLHRRNCRHS